MDDTGSRGHPLNIPRLQDPVMARRIFVLTFPLKEIRDSLKPSVGMVRRPYGLAWSVMNRPQLVNEKEWIKVCKILSRQWSPNDKPTTFFLSVGSDDVLD